MTSALFTPLTLRAQSFSNRIWVSPMCQYSSVDGLANNWHLVHLGALATGRPGLVMTEDRAQCPSIRVVGKLSLHRQWPLATLLNPAR